MGPGRRRIDAVLFDLGGTLIDYRDFAGWAGYAVRTGVDVDAEAMRDAFVAVERETDELAGPLGGGPSHGVPLEEFWCRVLGRATDRELGREVARRFLAALPPSGARPFALYSDARRSLEALRRSRLRLGVVSNSESEAGVRSTLTRAGIDGYFETVVSSGTEGVAKPDPEIFRRGLARLGVDAGRSVYVGNLEHTDALAAASAGLYGVWLNREGTGISDGTPEITSLLEVPLVVRRIDHGDSTAVATPPSHR